MEENTSPEINEEIPNSLNNNNIEENTKNQNNDIQDNENKESNEMENKEENKQKMEENNVENESKEKGGKKDIGEHQESNIENKKQKNKNESSPGTNKNKTKKRNFNGSEKKNKNNDEKGYTQKHFHNANIMNYIKQKEKKELEECSFRPKINKKIGFDCDNSNKNGLDKENTNDVVDRLMNWQKKVDKKKNDIKNKKNSEMSSNGCTFAPKLNTQVPKFEDRKVIGTKKYIDRIKNSRELQKQKEERLNPNYDQLYNKYYKNKEKTILDKNKKITKKEYQNYLNGFHNALMSDDE